MVFYSLAALNITSTGKEFGGSSLGFNRKLHVIAIHPNKPGVPKIDADIAYRAPNMCFNFDGEMAFVGSIPSQLTDNLHLRYGHSSIKVMKILLEMSGLESMMRLTNL